MPERIILAQMSVREVLDSREEIAVLIQFRVENHRSLRDGLVVSLVAADGLDPDDARLLHPKGLDEALLPAIAIYGANASGKSNVIGALAFMRAAVISSHRVWEPESGVPQEPFALSSKADAPSEYEVDILVGGARYRYGFVLSSARVEEEWLYTWSNREKQTWFERKVDVFDFGTEFQGENETIRGLTRPNSLFLSAAAQNNHPTLLPIFRWFSSTRFELRRGPRARAMGVSLAFRELEELFSTQGIVPNDPRQQDREAIIRLLQAADTGILDIRAESPDSLERPDNRRPGSRRPDLFFRHKSDDEERAWLPLSAESDGTVTLFEIATRLVRVLSIGGLLCIDELEASLHPMIALDLLRLFHDPTRNPMGAQLIFTTHDTNMLGNVLGESPLRRDQVWFTEKDQSGGTDIYPLSDFHPREHENLERGYLQGRYGAVPFLGQLFSKSENSENV